MKNRIKNKFTHLSQIIFLTFRFYFQNNLAANASACTFSFIFSFIPILMMTLSIFIGILHTSPAFLESFSNLASQISPFFDIDSYINSIQKGFVLNWMNLILAIFIIWMARKLFLSIIQSLKRIFNTVAPNRPVINQILTFAGEFLVIIICAVTFFTAFLTRQIFSLPVFNQIHNLSPLLFSNLSNVLVNLILYIILFIFTLIAYKVGSGTKPKFSLCLISSLLCTVSFYAAITIVTLFLNKANYNMIYGVLSNTIIILLEVYIFFTLFMIFAQMIYTIQFFNSHLLAEIYLLPKRFTPKPSDFLRRAIFITPSALMTEENLKVFKMGQEIYKNGDSIDGVYYLVEGSVLEEREGSSRTRVSGRFFGDIDFSLYTVHHSSATALTECRAIHISSEAFEELLLKNPQAALKAMSKLSRYAAYIYGRNESILL